DTRDSALPRTTQTSRPHARRARRRTLLSPDLAAGQRLALHSRQGVEVLPDVFRSSFSVSSKLVTPRRRAGRAVQSWAMHRLVRTMPAHGALRHASAARHAASPPCDTARAGPDVERAACSALRPRERRTGQHWLRGSGDDVHRGLAYWHDLVRHQFPEDSLRAVAHESPGFGLRPSRRYARIVWHFWPRSTASANSARKFSAGISPLTSTCNRLPRSTKAASCLG